MINEVKWEYPEYDKYEYWYDSEGRLVAKIPLGDIND